MGSFIKTRCVIIGLGISLLFGLFSCTSNTGKATNEIEVTALDFKFEAPDTVKSGWSTFRLKNEGKQEHFMYTYKIPSDITFSEYEEGVPLAFEKTWDKYTTGEINKQETVKMLGEEIASWFFTDVVPSGGVGLTEPGETAQSTIMLDPGKYIMECYVKMPDGTWHTAMGMYKMFTVTEDSTGMEAPTANYELSLTNYDISTSGSMKQGTNTIAVHARDTPDGFMMHDINLFRLNDTTLVNDLVEWMDWMELDQFTAPAPAYSLGGIEHMAEGMTGYMTVDLQPGNYVWISEMYGSRGMTKTFTVE